jgi:hypothetical protein
MKTIKLTETELKSLITTIVQETKFNTINYSDLTKSGDWDVNRHIRDELGVNMYKLDGGILKKTTKRKSGDKLFFLTDKEFEKSNEFLLKARDLESQAKKLRLAAKYIIDSGSSQPYNI